MAIVVCAIVNVNTPFVVYVQGRLNVDQYHREL